MLKYALRENLLTPAPDNYREPLKTAVFRGNFENAML